jgi:hypothetical protein
MRTLAALAVCLAMPAHAEEQCGGFADMAAALSEKYGEAQHFIGMDSRQLVTVLFINPATGSWTALLVEASGRACMVAAGVNGRIVEGVPE